MTEIVYSREVVTLTEGQVFQNPRFFAGPVAGAESVVVHGDWPDIVAAYVAAGASVTIINPPTLSTTHEPAPGDFGALAKAFVAFVEGGAPMTPEGADDGFGNAQIVPRQARKPK